MMLRLPVSASFINYISDCNLLDGSCGSAITNDVPPGYSTIVFTKDFFFVLVVFYSW